MRDKVTKSERELKCDERDERDGGLGVGGDCDVTKTAARLQRVCRMLFAEGFAQIDPSFRKR
jgi:hypothetical protein